ncbi:OVARIAN TUMOR DOMAIN-containing deubiquitinating enzyme 12-like isoform X1 [Punica granatum]|uniref:ubiquitinyl hydrolase 1 n=2 Tax=Punica granatum TaxID=22663 RepID=A0A218WA13_PUNGR|nr:OVARIAN TUMOR DOMAIN-containing deubiquitinating enzyme 12-like isoform X1 [Punica granatum]OWM68912.1 hypothetical protein CDL15_Pgr025099 [Punica granatum]
MMTYEQDPDVVQWGLRFFESDPYSDCGYCETETQEDAGCYQGHYVEEDHYGIQCNNIDSDELLAHALQEELSQLAVTETPGSPSAVSEELQPSFFSHDWHGHSIGSYGSGQEESEDVTHSSSCSSPEEKVYSGEDWPYSLELADEYAYDGEVGKRLNQMVPVPHVPRINGEIPSVDEATLDHQRLLGRLQLYGLVEHKVQGDGNCQFRALSDQIYRIPEHHEFVRQQIVNQLKSHPEIYEGYVPMAYDEYLEKMSMNGEWGDHVTLQAAADLYGVKIFVITSFKDTCYIEILPSDQRSKRVIFLSFWAEVHYNSIYREGDDPAFKTKKKKKWRKQAYGYD